jgi:hypothetical protein
MNANFPSKLAHTRFVDCENDRYGCNGDSDTKCSDNASCPSVSKRSLTSAAGSMPTAKADDLFVAIESGKKVYVHVYKEGNYMIKIFNVNGALIKTVQTANSRTLLDCSYFSSGIYLIQVTNGKLLQTAKIVLH